MNNSRAFDDDRSLSTVTQGEYSRSISDCGFEHYSLPLSGRSKEIVILLEKYHDMLCSNGVSANKAIVVIHGESGSGKTSLVEILREPVSNSRGYFVTGKFFQPTDGVKHEPHSAIMAAFSDICDLVLQSNDLNDRRKSEIKKTLGSYAQILIRSISNLAPFIDGETEYGNTVTVNESAFARFRDGCRQFLRAMSSEEHPIVLFLDDVQWMDEGSRLLIDMMLSADDLIKKFYIVLAYREEDAESVGNFFVDKNHVVDIQLKGLDQGSVNQIISALLASSSSQILLLSNYINSRTMGNPFHVVQFMSMLRKEGLIRFNTSKDQWVFNVEEIQREMKNSDTLLEVLSRRIMHLSEQVQTVLKIASMIGFFFPESVFLPVVSAEIRRTESDTTDPKYLAGFSRALDLVSEAMREGFIESADNGWQFAHDKLQASFQSSIEISEKRRLHGVLGNHYLFHRVTSDCICYAAFHLNKSYEYSKGCERVDKIARINLEAAKRCMDISAFTKATEWSRMGLVILNDINPEDKWTKNFKLTLELTEILAKMEFVTGNLESCKKLSQEAIQHCNSVDAKLNLLIINIEAHMLGHNKDESINAVQRALREMGISLPRHINCITFRRKLRKVRSLLSKKTMDDLGGAGIMNNRRMATSVKWLVDLFSYCLLRDDEILALYSALLATELTVKYGIFSYSTTAFVIYGIVEVFFGHADRARKCGELAMKILKKNNLKERECSTVELKLSFISHWSMKLKTLVPILEDVMNGAVKSGDVIYGGFCLVHSFQFRFLSGESLKSLESNMRAHYSQIIDNGLDAMMWWSQPCLQFAINMRRSTLDWRELTTLSGEIMNEDDFTSKILASKLESMLIVLWTFKAYLAFNFGYFELADEIYDKLKGQKILTNTSYIGPFYYFLGAMISFERYRETKKRFFLRKARQNTEVMKRFNKSGNPNTVEFLAIMKAEGISVKSRDEMAIKSAYSIAIDDCAKVGFVHLEALAHERLSSELYGLRDYRQSKLHLNRAIEICEVSWEATGKRDWLLSVERNRFNPQ